MDQRPLGRTGLTVSALGLGCGNVGGLFVRGDPADRRRAVECAVEAGVTYFDTAQMYGEGRSEENLGQALREVRPPRAVIGTKVNLTRAEVVEGPAAVRRQLEASLRRLGREQVDLYQLHNRITLASTEGRNVTVDEALGPILDGLRAVQAAGLTRHIGFTGLGETVAVRRVAECGAYASVQCYCNVLNPSAYRPGAGIGGETESGQDFDGLIGQASAAGLGVIAIRIFAAGAASATTARHPIAGNPGGELAGGGGYQADVDRARRLLPLAAELGLDGPLELALRFALAVPGVSTALAGVAALAEWEQALRWAARGPLDPADVERVLSPG